MSALKSEINCGLSHPIPDLVHCLRLSPLASLAHETCVSVTEIQSGNYHDKLFHFTTLPFVTQFVFHRKWLAGHLVSLKDKSNIK